MRCPSFPRMWPWPKGDKNAYGARGSVTLIALFLSFMFSVLGLSLVYLLRVSLQVSSSKKRSAALTYAAEVGLKQGWEQVSGLVVGRSFPLLITDDRQAEFLADVLKKGTRALQEALGAGPPFSLRGGWENQTWEAETRFGLDRAREQNHYFQAWYAGQTVSKGMMSDTRATHCSSAESILEIAAGRVPLSIFPLLVGRPEDPEEADHYAERHRVSFSPPDRGTVSSLINFSEPSVLPQDACPALSEALQIKLFKPQDLTHNALRRALRLEESDDPVPDGVYLIRTDLGLGGVFVQGDLDELILAIDQDDQVLCFRAAPGCWVLRVNPQARRTSFITPTETFSFDLIPAGTIVVDGEVHSLGGGRVDEHGDILLSPADEAPCLLREVQLTIVSSKTMTLTAPLIRQGVSWQNGIPYIRNADSKLTLFCTGRDFSTEEPVEGGVVIGPGTPLDMKVEASIVAPGRGFLVEGEGKTVRLAGSIQASAITNPGNALIITVEPEKASDSLMSASIPETAQSVLLVTSLKLRKWRDPP